MQKNEVTSGFIVHQIIQAIYSIKMPPVLFLIGFSCAFCFGLIPVFSRMSYGLSIFGESILENVIFSNCILGFFSGLNIMVFGFISAFDFKRRFNAMKKLGELIAFPGIPIREFLFQKPKEETDQKDKKQEGNQMAGPENEVPQKDSKTPYVFIDQKKRLNVFAWMNCGKTLRSFGEAFYLRIQGYTSILLLYSFFNVIILNFIGWMQIRHHVSTIYLIVLTVVVIASIRIYSISKVTKLQSLSSSQRDLIRKELFLQEEEIWHSDSIGNRDQNQLKSAKALLEKVDENVNFHELTHNPTRVLGHVASQNVTGSALGIILTGCIFAIEGFSGSGITYDQNGWFNS